MKKLQAKIKAVKEKLLMEKIAIQQAKQKYDKLKKKEKGKSD